MSVAKNMGTLTERSEYDKKNITKLKKKFISYVPRRNRDLEKSVLEHSNVLQNKTELEQATSWKIAREDRNAEVE